ncbi:hypothetical protein ACIQCM_13635 [Pseudarthrobacter sp. NPDC092439]|uniref:hypothetical protein n=1 Tax=unclassified Pseudarthrobacter TaxID=2647000 RepID=UPI00382640B7
MTIGTAPSVVFMSKDELDALVETSYLMSSPMNAYRLLTALKSAADEGAFNS